MLTGLSFLRPKAKNDGTTCCHAKIDDSNQRSKYWLILAFVNIVLQLRQDIWKKQLCTRINNIDLKEYNYDLPAERIAQYPAPERDLSKLLVYKAGRISNDIFRNIGNNIPSGSLLVFNNTRVIRARILFRKETGAMIEILCLEPLSPSEYELSLGSKEPVEWKCIIGNLKKWKSGIITTSYSNNKRLYTLAALKVQCGRRCLENTF